MMISGFVKSIFILQVMLGPISGQELNYFIYVTPASHQRDRVVGS